MSNKHYFPSTAANTLVPRALRGLVTANPHLGLDERARVVYNRHHNVSNVSIIGGGGSGHEPAWSGFVGEGLLSAAICGDIFASPSTKQILAGMELVPSKQGTIFLVTNYTGDRLHFGLAVEKAQAQGLADNVIVLPATDDVSIGRSKIGRVGRRGLPGHKFTMKVLCAAAAEKKARQQCIDIVKAMNAQTVSIGSSLDHCHVPGRQHHRSIPDDVCVLGAGIHNELGQQMISPFPSIEDLIERCLNLLCDQRDLERAFVQFEPNDKTLLLVNNYGGLSVLELNVIADEIQIQLATRWNMKPVRTFCGAFETSLNAPGFSVSLCNVSAASKQSGFNVDDLIVLLDRPTASVAWPNTHRPGPKRDESSTKLSNHHSNGLSASSTTVKVDRNRLMNGVREACKFAIEAEPKLTEWDLVMWDGDCGEAIKGLAESVLHNLDALVPPEGCLLGFLTSLGAAVDDMGGTLGAILGILLVAFTGSLKSNASQQSPTTNVCSADFASALSSAVESLKSHTEAREGDRTVMDVLLPFTEEFAKTKSFASAVKLAATKAEETRLNLQPKFGQASYVGGTKAQELPDPGAWALYEIVAGLAAGLDLD